MIVATCKLCRQLVEGSRFEPRPTAQAAGNGGGAPAPQVSEVDQDCMAFATAFGRHIEEHHPTEFAGLQALLIQSSAVGAQVAGYMALAIAESADPEWLAWRAADAKQIAKGLAELSQMVWPAA